MIFKELWFCKELWFFKEMWFFKRVLWICKVWMNLDKKPFFSRWKRRVRPKIITFGTFNWSFVIAGGPNIQPIKSNWIWFSQMSPALAGIICIRSTLTQDIGQNVSKFFNMAIKVNKVGPDCKVLVSLLLDVNIHLAT